MSQYYNTHMGNTQPQEIPQERKYGNNCPFCPANIHGYHDLIKCTCGAKICRLSTIYKYCDFCEYSGIHIVKKCTLSCKAHQQPLVKDMCCRCYDTMQQNNTDLLSIKSFINNTFCDPASIILDYFDNDFEDFIESYQKHAYINCSRCNLLICRMHSGICWRTINDRVVCSGCDDTDYWTDFFIM
jgi:hypothetical protein